MSGYFNKKLLTSTNALLIIAACDSFQSYKRKEQ